MSALKKFTYRVIAGANGATALLMFLVGYSDLISPASHPLVANLGLAFPLFLFINLLFLVFWLWVYKPYAWIPVAGYVLCFFPLRTYMPINWPQRIPEGAIKVMSYNVYSFPDLRTTPIKDYPIIQYILKEDPDILCMQESPAQGVVHAKLDSAFSKVYPYRYDLNAHEGRDVISIFSKFNIMRSQIIKYESKGNISAAYWVNIHGNPVIIINNHFETTGLSLADRLRFKRMVKGELSGDSIRPESQRILSRLNLSSSIRAPQAEAVARFISSHSDESIICVGDFNDSPISYTHHTISKNLTDCYTAAGNGPGISYHKGGFYVRIDNIMCSSDWKPYRCKVDNEVALSDHYPIYCWLKKQPKSKKMPIKVP